MFRFGILYGVNEVNGVNEVDEVKEKENFEVNKN